MGRVDALGGWAGRASVRLDRTGWMRAQVRIFKYSQIHQITELIIIIIFYCWADMKV